MAERFYLNLRLAPGRVLLEGAEAHHLATVRRIRAGERVYLFNGDGREYHAEVVAVAKKSVELLIHAWEAPQRDLCHRLIVACPLPKGDRGQFLVEKLTELGVTQYIPLQSERSVVHPRESHLEKLRRYVIEASKQCGRNVLMEVSDLRTLRELLASEPMPTRRLLAHPGGAGIPDSAPVDCVMAIGPEGGFTDSEASDAAAAGWKAVSLGPRTLRIETAAILLASLHSIQQ
jgi:16S rRNA (uracil1498-N3)-methyltransferase